jgi:predicted MFS family arabinose efflux permease
VRRVLLLVYALVFVTELSQAAIVPLLPTIARRLALTDVETGAVLAATTFATVLVAVPIGMFADRIGPFRITQGAAVLVAVSAVVQAMASSFPVLLAGRALYGVAFAAVWTAGVSLVSAATATRRAGAIGGTIAVGGAAHFVGPTGAGFLAEHAGLAAPFFAVAAAALIVAGLLAGTRPPAVEPAPRERLRDALRVARRQHELRSVLAIMGLLGLVAGIVPLLVPLVLDENGLSAGQIGVVFSAGAGVWMVVSAVVARLASRTVRVSAAGVGVLALGAVLLLPVLTLATAGVAVFLVLRAAAQAPLSTISYPLAEIGARVSGIGSGTVIGLVNVVWAATAAAAPILGGALAGGLGARPTFALVALGCALTGLWILAATHRERARVEAFETG